MESYDEISCFVAINQKYECNFLTVSYRQILVFRFFLFKFLCVFIMESILMAWVDISQRYVFLVIDHNFLCNCTLICNLWQSTVLPKVLSIPWREQSLIFFSPKLFYNVQDRIRWRCEWKTKVAVVLFCSFEESSGSSGGSTWRNHVDKKHVKVRF